MGGVPTEGIRVGRLAAAAEATSDAS